MKYIDYKNQIEKDPEYIKAKEALRLQFALGEAVISARLQRGWSQAELAQRAGTRQANISRIESGIANPTLNVIQKITQVLDLEISFSPVPSSTSFRVGSFTNEFLTIKNSLPLTADPFRLVAYEKISISNSESILIGD